MGLSFWYEQTLYQNKVKTTYIKKEPIKLFLNIPHNKIDLLFSFNLIDSLDNLSKKREVVYWLNQKNKEPLVNGGML